MWTLFISKNGNLHQVATFDQKSKAVDYALYVSSLNDNRFILMSKSGKFMLFN